MVMMLMRALFVFVNVLMMMLILQKPRAGEIHEQPEHRNRAGLPIVDRDWLEHAEHRLIADEDRNHREHQCARIPGELAKLSLPERKAIVMRMVTGEPISEDCDPQRSGMGRHVPTI
jgi:hypothetical protein